MKYERKPIKYKPCIHNDNARKAFMNRMDKIGTACQKMENSLKEVHEIIIQLKVGIMRGTVSDDHIISTLKKTEEILKA